MSTVVKKRPAEDDGDELEPRSQGLKKVKNEYTIGGSSISGGLEQFLNMADLAAASQATIEKRFRSIAEAILCNCHLVVGSISPTDGTKSESEYEVLELEFYLWMDGSHEDPFTHGSEEQRICGQWYFHRSPKRSTDSRRNLTSQTGYRGGSRKGLDLTIGRGPSTSMTSANGELDIRGGILLRSLRRISDNKIISGPSLLVDEILQASHAGAIPELVSSKWKGNIYAFRSDGPIYLCFRSRPSPNDSTTPMVYPSPRIGLDLSHPGTTPNPDHPRLIFLSRQYRFFVHPELLEKGRPQTFIGILNYCLRNGHILGTSTPNGSRSPVVNEKLNRAVMKIMDVKQSTVDKYFTEYLAGLDKGIIKSYIGTAGKGASSSPAVYLRMVGTLKRMISTIE